MKALSRRIPVFPARTVWRCRETRWLALACTESPPADGILLHPLIALAILRGFSNANSSLEAFCEQNGLEILMTGEFDGVILKVKESTDDTPDYFYAMLQRTQEFYSILAMAA
jgi:hypothetical protein